MRSSAPLRILAVLVLAAALPALAQSTPRPRPPGTKPLEEPPPPPAMSEPDPAIKADVSTRKDGENTVQEYRHKGKLFMMRVTTPQGASYVLVDHRGDGTFARQDTLAPQLSVPQWVLKEF
jgi:hypothetical protein